MSAAYSAEMPIEELHLPDVPPEPPGSITLLQRLEKQLARYPLARATTAIPRTGRWAVDAAITEAGRIPGAPQVRMSAAILAQVAMDETIIALAQGPNRSPHRADYTRVATELSTARRLYDTRGWLDDPRSYHRDPPDLVDVSRRRGWALGECYQRIMWPSGYEPHAEEPGAERWAAFEANRTAAAWVMEHPGDPRPWLVAIHGFGTGATFADLITFRAAHIHHDLGWNVAAIVLPVHGSRRPSRLGGEDFLSFDMMNAVHAISQSVWDIRRLISWVRTREPTAMAMYGVSLGGYLASLTSCFVGDLDAVIAGIPVTDFPALLGHQAPAHVRRRAAEHGILHGNAEIVHRVVSPLAMDPLVPKERRFIFAGLGDRMAVPAQAHALWEHWDQPTISWFPGNHVGYLWSAKVGSFVDSVLNGVTQPEAGRARR